MFDPKGIRITPVFYVTEIKTDQITTNDRHHKDEATQWYIQLVPVKSKKSVFSKDNNLNLKATIPADHEALADETVLQWTTYEGNCQWAIQNQQTSPFGYKCQMTALRKVHTLVCS